MHPIRWFLFAALACFTRASQVIECTCTAQPQKVTDGWLMPWLPPEPMKCMDHTTWPEECIGTKAFCNKQKDPATCLSQRERPVFQEGLEANCPSPPTNSEACVGTIPWCQRHDIRKAWKSVDKCIEYRRQRPPSDQLKKWELGRGCSQKTEECLGTDSWCVWHDDTYSSQDNCFRSRKPRPKGKTAPKFGNADFFADSEFRNGTETLCLAIENREIQTECYRARGQIPFQVPFSEGCPTIGSDEAIDERCVGSVLWCELLKNVHESAESCMSLRAERPKIKLPWRAQDSTQCKRPASEACLGTEKTCIRLRNQQQRHECFAWRETAPLKRATADQCPEERCIGTLSWCIDHWKATGYHSESEYFGIHGVNPAGFMKSIYNAMAEEVQDVLVTSALKRANATMIWEIIKYETQDGDAWMDAGIKAGRNLLEETKRGGYLLRGVKMGVDLFFQNSA